MHARILVLTAALAFGGCRGKQSPAPAPSASLPEAVAPDSLAFELSIGNPKDTWLRSRQLGARWAEALPRSLPVLLATSLSLPPAAAGNLDESLPIVGALLAPPGTTEPELVLGMHVVSGAELVASLTLGDAAKFRRVELGPRLVRLVSAPGSGELDGALGVSGNYLLLASKVHALEEAGRFVAESVSKRARSEPGLTVSASQGVLSGVLSARLRQLWQAREHDLAERARAERDKKGRPADFADPEALLAGLDGTIESWLSILESAHSLSLSVTPEVGRLRAELTLAPGADGRAALLARDLTVGSAGPLLALPQDTIAALLLRGDDPAKGNEPSALPELLARVFGSRLSAADSPKISAALERFAAVRKGASVVALVPGRARGLLLTFELRDAPGFSSAMGDIVSLLELPPVKSWVAGFWGAPSVTLSSPSADGERQARVRFKRAQGSQRTASPSSLSVRWRVREGVGQVLISADEATGFAELAGRPALGQSPWFAAGQGLGDETAFAGFADAQLFGATGPQNAPLLLSLGRRDGRIIAALDVSPGALSAVLGSFALDRSP